MSVLPSWPTSDEFYAAASRPEGVGFFEFVAAHRSVKRTNAEYRQSLYRHYCISALYAMCYVPPWFVARFVQNDWIGLPISLLLWALVVLVATPIYAKSCVKSGAFMKRKVLDKLVNNSSIDVSQSSLNDDSIR